MTRTSSFSTGPSGGGARELTGTDANPRGGRALLLQVALRLRGSHVGSVWALVLGGLIVMSVGDAASAHLSSLGQEPLDPFVDTTFIPSYGLIAGGTHRQL